MAIEDKSQPPPLSPKPLPPFSPEDEKKAQQELARLRRNKERGFEGKTLWDWLQLLGVPILLAFATIGFSFVQFYLADQQHVQDQNNALDQQHATTLQTYIDNIQELLLKDNLQGSRTGDEVAILARARTLTALRGLDPDRKGRLIQFLYEAVLIDSRYIDGKQQDPVIDLTNADLTNAILTNAILISTSFYNANLTNATLTNATLSKADLHIANLSNADLIRANLSNAHLFFADLSNADLTDANLYSADLTDANLNSADLTNAKLTKANLTNATLSFANLNSAILTQQQLDQVSSCKDATLPTGLICNKTP